MASCKSRTARYRQTQRLVTCRDDIEVGCRDEKCFNFHPQQVCNAWRSGAPCDADTCSFLHRMTRPTPVRKRYEQLQQPVAPTFPQPDPQLFAPSYFPPPYSQTQPSVPQTPSFTLPLPSFRSARSPMQLSPPTILPLFDSPVTIDAKTLALAQIFMKMQESITALTALTASQRYNPYSAPAATAVTTATAHVNRAQPAPADSEDWHDWERLSQQMKEDIERAA